MIRGVLDFSKCMEAIPEGFKAMVPAILILTFAWTLKGTTDMMGAKDFVQNAMESASGSLFSLLPAVIFIVGCLMAFATGTSWGTFGILIPIVCAVFEGKNNELIYAITAAVLSFISYAIVGPLTYRLHVKWFVMLPIFIALMVLFVFILKVIKQKNPESYASADTKVADAE